MRWSSRRLTDARARRPVGGGAPAGAVAVAPSTRKAELESTLASARAANDAGRIASLEGQIAAAADEATSLGNALKELFASVAELQARFKNAGRAETL